MSDAYDALSESGVEEVAALRARITELETRLKIHHGALLGLFRLGFDVPASLHHGQGACPDCAALADQ